MQGRKGPVAPGELLAAAPGFELLDERERHAVAERLRATAVAAGEVVVREGEVGDRMYLVESGQAEVTVEGADGAVLLDVVGPGELIGELALLAPDQRRAATVTAQTPMALHALASADFADVVRAAPDVRAALGRGRESMLLARFLKLATPFAQLDGRRLRRLAEHLEPAVVPAGALIVEAGEEGDSCYVLHSGVVEVLVPEADGERRLSTLRPGTLFGEGAVLGEGRRTATIRAIEDSEVLELRRDELVAAMADDAGVANQLLQLLSLRDRPVRSPGVTVHERTTASGEQVTILKHAARGSYFQLSEQGRFVWDRLDGSRSVKDLALAVFREFQVFAPHAVAETLAGLAAAGLVDGVRIRPDVLERVTAPTGVQRAVTRARRVLEWRVQVRDVDGFVTALYRRLRWLFTVPGQVLLAGVAVLGLVAFLTRSGQVGSAIHGPDGNPALLLLVLPAYALALVVHELGHALATKHHGREVHRAGIGWYWVSPIAFVDTSDMWLEGRRGRIIVSAAGPYAQAVVAGVAAIAAAAVGGGTAGAVLWQVALGSYIGVLLNLNPLLEYDGYYMLMDGLDRPNLRPRALAWLGTELRPALRDRARLRGHWLDLAYGAASIAYVVVVGMVTLRFYRLLMQDWLTTAVSSGFAGGAAYVFAALVAGAAAAALLSELKGQRRPSVTGL